MKTLTAVAIGIALVAVLSGAWFVLTYNSLVGLDQKAQSQWGQVETQYQRRIDLIPNLISTVQGYMQFESGLLTNITTLRSQWMAATNQADQIGNSTALDAALGRLLAVYENYPELQSITAVRGLMDELAGTENRIAVERMRFNDAILEYNTAIKTIPGNLIAGTFGFTEKAYYQSTFNQTGT